MIQRSDEYNEGYEAFENGEEESDCPYDKGSKQEIDWLEGYNDAEVNSENEDEENDDD